MIKLIPRLLVGAVLILILLLGVAVVVVATTDFNAYREEIAAELESVAGRDVQLNGELDVRVFSLSPAIVVNDVTVANAPWGTRPEMIRAERIEARASLLPLIFGNVVIEQFVLVGADMLLETDAQGRRNWVLADGGGETNGSSARGDIRFLNNLQIDNTRIEYRDGFTELSSVITLDHIRMLSPSRRSEIRLDVSGTYNGTAITGEGTMGAIDALLSGSPEYPINMRVTYGTSDMDARLLADLSDPVPRINGTVNAERLNLDELGSGGETAASSRLFSENELPVGGLRAVDAQLDLTAESLILAGNQVRDVRADVTLEGGNFNMTLQQLEHANGNLQATLNLDLRQRVPRFALRMTGEGLSLSEVTRGALNRTVVEAPLSLRADVRGAGRSMHDIASSLEGPFVVDVGEGRIASGFFNILSSDVAGAVLPWTEGNRSPTLNCMVSRFDFSNGVGRSRILIADTNRMSAVGNGVVNLGTERLNILVRPIGRGASLSQIASLIPIRISGPISNPSASPDPAAAAETIGEAIGDLPGQARDLIGGLLGEEGSGSRPSGVSCSGARAIAADGRPAQEQGQQRQQPQRRDGGGILERINPFDR